MASARPSTEPSRKPATDSHSVAATSSHQMSLSDRSTNDVTMSSGCGSTRVETHSLASAISQTRTITPRKSSGAPTTSSRRRGASLDAIVVLGRHVGVADAVQPLVGAEDELLELRLLGQLRGARTLERNLDDVGDPARSRRHDEDAVGEQDRLGDVVSDQHRCRVDPRVDLEQLEIQALARELIDC